jgi:hypothetical protein
LQQVARLESPKPNEVACWSSNRRRSTPPGSVIFAVKDSCGRLNAISIDYGGRTFTQAAISSNRAEFTFGFFAGPSALTTRATDDCRFLQYQAPYFDQSGLAKAVMIWHGTTDLDLQPQPLPALAKTTLDWAADEFRRIFRDGCPSKLFASRRRTVDAFLAH